MQSDFVPVSRTLDRHDQTGDERALLHGLRQGGAFVEEQARVMWRLRRMAWLAALGLASWGLIIGMVLLVV